MLNEMICFRCKDVVVTSAKTVALPYMCEECLTVLAVEVGSKVERNPIYPAKSPASTSVTSVTSQTVQAESELDHDTTTVENTTLLIADLEQQVSDSKAALDESNELIGDLTQQLAKSRENLKLYDEAGRTVTGLLIATTKERDELGMRVLRLISFNKYLGSALHYQRERTKKYYEKSQESWKKSSFYENLGFWERLFNPRYSSKLVDPRGF